MFYGILSLLIIGLASVPAFAAEKDNVPSVLENGASVRRNGHFFNNRPLYGSHGNPQDPYYWVFAGDRPFLRLGGSPWVDGCFVLGFQNAAGEAKWLMDFASVEARYPGGRMEWVASDPAFPGVTIALHALPLGEGTGLAAQAHVKGAAAGDRLVWMLGAAYRRVYVNNIDAMDTALGGKARVYGFVPAEAEGDRITLRDGVIRVEPPRGDRFRYTLTACSAASELRIADADQWQTPKALLASVGDRRPVACGVTPISSAEPVTWIVRAWLETDKRAAPPQVAADFLTAWERVEQLRRRVVSRTPDARLDFMIQACLSALDGLWRQKAYGYSCTGPFQSPILGFRHIDGGTSYGWHDRVLTEARTYIASQVTGETYKARAEHARVIDGNGELARFQGKDCHPATDSRFFGKGRLIPDSNSTIYDMQSQFFDQLIEDWRFTADPEMEKLLRPALELHLDYIDRCFDPDGDGTYESINNTFLTDSVWYNGGGTPDETAFAWRGHQAARDLARCAGDPAAVKRHEAKLALIRKGFFEKLWVEKAGHPGAYREQGGHQRLHADAWLPGLYLPMDCPGLMNDEQMASTLNFVETALEHEPRLSGGVRVWPSNWVPSIWSNRSKSSGDEYALALGYCFAGLPEGALEIIQGNFSETAFESGIPASTGQPMGFAGVDFSDALGALARTVVSGLFGYRPDRPNGLITIAPQFPAAWDHASFEHPQFKLAYQRQATTERLSVELERASALQLELPFYGTGVKSARLNGREVKGTIKPGFGRSVYLVQVPVTKKAELELEIFQALAPGVAQAREVKVGSPVTLSVDGGRITEVRDAQRVLESVKVDDGKVRGCIANNNGNHRVLALVQMGENAPQYRVFDFKVRDPKAEQYAAEKNLREAPTQAHWSGIDLTGQMNGRITDIFRQEYLSPRPDTLSLRLARNGYSVWNAVYSGKQPPGVDLSNTWPRRPAPVYDVALGDFKPSQELTLEVWVRPDLSSKAAARILEWGGLALDIPPNSGIVKLNLGPEFLVGWPSICSERASHIVVVLRGGKQVEIYIDGRRIGKTLTLAADWNALTNGATLRLGAGRKGEMRLLGRIDRVAISGRAAAKEQLQNRTVDAAALAGTVADWRLPESGGEQVASAVPGAPALMRQEVSLKLAKDLPEVLKVSGGMLEVPQGAKFLWNPGARDTAFTSLWDNWPRKVIVPVNRKGDSVWLLVAGSTNPMQVRIANAVLRFDYANGVKEELELVNPMNFWSLCHFQGRDFDYSRDAFCLPKEPPSQAVLGSNCRAMVYGWKLRPGVALKSVTLESLSQEVVIGLMGVSICNP